MIVVQRVHEAESAHRRQDELNAACQARAQAQLINGCGIEVAGLDLAGQSAQYRGTYRAVDERDGWPVLQNEHGMWLFRPSAASGLSHRWFIWREHTPAVDQCYSYIDAPDGSFPVGEQTWKVWERDGFVDRPLTMRVVV